MKIKFLFSIVLISFSLISIGQKDSCKVGLYVNSIYDFKIDEKSYMIDFWMWMNFKNDKLEFKDNQDIVNSKLSEITHFNRQKINGENWIAQKCKAEIMHHWDVSNFPFDRQKLKVIIEDAENDTTDLIYVADKLNSKLDPKFVSEEWNIESFEVKEQIRTYATTYGNPQLSGTSSYPQIVAEIVIKRNHSWLLLLKLLTGAYVAFLISGLVFFVSSENQDSRFGLCVGGLFAAIGNKYIAESVVPSTNANSLLDNAHNVTFGYILLISIICIISLRLFESEDPKKKALSLKIDKISFWSVLISYIIINVLIVYFAIQ